MVYRYGPPFPQWGRTPLIVDDGGDASLLVHMGYRAEQDVSTINRKGLTAKSRLSWTRLTGY